MVLQIDDSIYFLKLNVSEANKEGSDGEEESKADEEIGANVKDSEP